MMFEFGLYRIEWLDDLLQVYELSIRIWVLYVFYRGLSGYEH